MCSGYLYKSPPENQFKTQKSWKRRFFVLLKYRDNTCQLKYYKNDEKNKPLGDIDLSKITYMFLYPEMHTMWKWIHNKFRCSSSSVMFIRVPERDYFLIGENSWEMDKWFTALFDILNNRPHRLLDPKTFGSHRHISEPPQSDDDQCCFNYVSAAATAKFYSEPAKVEELYTGYLLKSPAQPALIKNTKSWKRRFFVLSKTSEDAYELTYHANNERRDKPLGVIDLSKIILLFSGPEAHQKWDWIQKNFKCSPSSVLFMKVEEDTPKPSRDYFLIEENSDDVDGWLNALVKVLKTQKSRKLKDNRSRSASVPGTSLEPMVEDEPDDRRSAPELMLTYPSMYSHYDYPRRLSEPPAPIAFKIPFIEDEDEEDEMQDESPEESEYMSMAALQSALEADQQEADTACTQKNEMHTHVEKEICISHNDLKNSLTLTQAEGKPCVSDCRKIQDSCLFHKGDQILAFNDLLIDTVEEIQTYLRRLSKDEVKLTIRRFIGSQPLHSELCLS
ncbi:pleckstrin homology domain-containing family S member 1-like [Garra rufa]|uniref:pleckstrin homology domain-containing family S member 1-like n=1 Tax=Garra rufa TaxID=137080 RepID=UPI003CCED66B